MSPYLRLFTAALVLATIAGFLLTQAVAAELPPRRSGVGPSGEWPHPAVTCSPADATFAPAENNFAALDLALTKALASPGTDGVATVAIPAGSYALRYADRATFAVNARGADVELCGQGGIASFRMADGQHRFQIALPGVAVLRNLEFVGAWPGIPAARSFEIVNTRIAETSSECLFWSEQAQDGYGLVDRSEFDGCRSANPTGHSMYLSNRRCVFVLTNSTLRAQGTLEVWRSLCRFNYVAGNHIANVRDVSVPVLGKTAAAFDFPSCGLTVFKRNRIEVVGDVPAIVSRQRRSIGGCDLPEQTEHLDTGIAGAPDGLVRQAEFWQSVRVGTVPVDAEATVTGLLANDQLFPLLLWGNDFVNVTGSTGQAVGLYSTAAMDDTGTGGNADSEYLRVPPEWTERHFGLSTGDLFYGWSGGNWRGLVNSPPDPTTLPDVQEWFAKVLKPTLLPRGFESATLPAKWMPDTPNVAEVCTWLAGNYRWAGEGFPSCDGLPWTLPIPGAPALTD